MVDKVLDQIDLLPKWSEGICNEISSPASAPINPRDEGLENLNQVALLDINILYFFQLTCPLKKKTLKYYLQGSDCRAEIQ